MSGYPFLQNSQGNSYPLMSGWPCSTSAMPNPWVGQSAAATILPRMDIIETDSSVVYVYDLPGADSSQINFKVSALQVAISAPLVVKNYSNTCYIYQERPRGSYFRIIQPPAGVSLDEVKADFHNGTLEIIFPKLPTKTYGDRASLQHKGIGT